MFNFIKFLRTYTPPSLPSNTSSWSATTKAGVAAIVIAVIAASTLTAINFQSTYPITPYWQIGITPNSNPVTYYAKAPNGTILWTSTNLTLTTVNTLTSAASATPSTVYIANLAYNNATTPPAANVLVLQDLNGMRYMYNATGLISITGPKGDTGDTGPAGADGADGTNGTGVQDYDYLVEPYGSDFRVINGTDGTVITAWTSSNGTAALANCVAAGKTIAIKGIVVGRIEVTASNIVLIGVGSGATLKLPANADDNVVDITGNGVINVKVLNLIIDGNKANNAVGDGIYCDTDYVSTDTGHIFQNLRIIGTSGDGIELVADSRVCMLDNIYVGGNAADSPEGRGFNLAGTDHHFTNCEVGFSEKSGFYIKTTNVKFTNCKAFACGSDNDANDNAGFSLIGTNSGCYNSLTNCHAQDNKYTGFLLYNGARDNVFTNCHSDDNGQTSDSTGFKLDTDCVRNKLVGCYVFDYAGTHMTMGLVIGTGCDYNTVVGNEFWNGQNDGVYISGGDYNYIQGNTINGFTAACINIVSGTGNRVLENNFVDVGTDVLADGGTATEVNEVYSFPERGTDLNFVGSYSGRYFDASGDEAFFSFYVPSSASEVLSVKVMVVANGTGTYRLNFSSEFGASAEDSDTNTDSLADVDVACTADYIHAYDVTTCFTGLAAGDYAGMRVFGDTSNTAQLLVIQVVVSYV